MSGSESQYLSESNENTAGHLHSLGRDGAVLHVCLDMAVLLEPRADVDVGLVEEAGGLLGVLDIPLPRPLLRAAPDYDLVAFFEGERVGVFAGDGLLCLVQPTGKSASTTRRGGRRGRPRRWAITTSSK